LNWNLLCGKKQEVHSHKLHELHKPVSSVGAIDVGITSTTLDGVTGSDVTTVAVAAGGFVVSVTVASMTMAVSRVRVGNTDVVSGQLAVGRGGSDVIPLGTKTLEVE